MPQPVVSLNLAMRREWSISDLFGYADALNSNGQLDLAIECYRDWLAHHEFTGYHHFVYYNYGVVLLNANDLSGAKEAFNEAIRLQPDFYPSYINLGNAVERLGLPLEAAKCWQQLVDRLPSLNGENISYKTSALKQIARVSGMVEAEEVLRQSLEINPHQHEVIEHWINWRQLQCKWPVMVPFGPCDKTHLMKGFAPLSLGAYTDDAMLQLSNACMFHKSEVGQPHPTFQDAHLVGSKVAKSRPRVGYLSSDLRVHAIGFLMVEMFEQHDRNQVEVFVYSIGQQFEDHIRARIRGVVEHWCDLSGLTDEAAVKRILADRIEILVDVNGYTHSARTKMLAMRPAPIIVNWLGYPGTMGSPYHNYIIADEVVIPKEHEIFYSEQVMRLPCYQPNDRNRLVSPHRPSRQEAGLPDGVMVYSCFNSVKKITSFTWQMWMRIMQQVPNSVLWLLYESDIVKDRLQTLASQHGIEAERVIFGSRELNHDHLARYPLVDLMLDSSPYGAHTTASDALWMGVPILTLAGLAFASRVCSSLVTAAGLQELVCTTPEEYVTRAVEFGHNPELLQFYKQKLTRQRDTCLLFDTPLLVRSLEGIYWRMQEDLRQNRVYRPDLSNLELYQEIGIELDQDGVWFGSVEKLTSAYVEKLIQRDQLCFIKDDSRLWNNEARRCHAQMVGEFLDRIVAYEDANDVTGLLEYVQHRPYHPQEMMTTQVELLAQLRVRSAYILAMMLANAGQRTPEIAIALGVGGLMFDNEEEVTRGLGYLQPPEAPLLAWQPFRERIFEPMVSLLQTQTFVPGGARVLDVLQNVFSSSF